MHVLGDQAAYGLRLYVLDPRMDQARQGELMEYVRDNVPVTWN
jgi:hypothetical protein